MPTIVQHLIENNYQAPQNIHDKSTNWCHQNQFGFLFSKTSTTKNKFAI